MSACVCMSAYVQIYHELAGLQELRFNWRDKVPPYSVTTSLAGAMQHYPDRDLLLAMYHVPQVRGCRQRECMGTCMLTTIALLDKLTLLDGQTTMCVLNTWMFASSHVLCRVVSSCTLLAWIAT
jgi:hypothetical protein